MFNNISTWLVVLGVNQVIVLIMFLDNIVASLTHLYLISLWILDLTAVFLFLLLFSLSVNFKEMEFIYINLYIFINNGQFVQYIIVIWTQFGVLAVTLKATTFYSSKLIRKCAYLNTNITNSHWCFIKKLFLKFSQYSLENNCVRVLSCRPETCNCILLLKVFMSN